MNTESRRTPHSDEPPPNKYNRLRFDLNYNNPG